MRDKYRLKTDRKAWLYPKDYLKIISKCNDKQAYTIKFLMNTGARINEIRHVDEQDLEAEHEVVNLRITKVRAKLKERRPNQRKIPVSSTFFKYLKKNIKTHKILSTMQTGNVLKKYAKEIGLGNWEDFSAHNLRKTFGCWLLALGIREGKIAKHLGHTVDTLLNSYASADILQGEDKILIISILGNLPERLSTKQYYT